LVHKRLRVGSIYWIDAAAAEAPDFDDARRIE